MRILLLSDIHAKLVAVEAVLEKAQGFDAVWCLGDIVGYGPNPNKCIQLIKKQPGLKSILGNHDAAAINNISSENFNSSAKISTNWARKRLTDESKEFLQSLPKTIDTDLGLMVHGSPPDNIMEYLLSIETAKKNFSLYEQELCFVGHSHLPMYFRKYPDGSIQHKLIKRDGGKVHFEHRMICNPGSVGQPRDRNPKASFAIIDSEAKTINYQRAKYDVKKTQTRMAHHKLPLRQITRLKHGW